MVVAVDITLTVQLALVPGVNCNNKLPELIAAVNDPKLEPVNNVPYSVISGVLPSCITFTSLV